MHTESSLLRATSRLPWTKPLTGVLLPLAAALLGCVPLVSAAPLTGSGNVTTQERKVSGFHALASSDFGSVVVTQGDTETLTVEGEDNLLPLVQAEVDDKGTLHLGLKPVKEGVRATKPLTYKLSVKSLDHVALAGSGNFTANTLTVKEDGTFDVVLNGSGNVTVNVLNAGALKASLQGSGNFKFAGAVERQTISLAGSGDYDGAELRTKTTELSLSGSGDADLWATDKLKVDLSGSGDVSYYGKPTVDKHVAGSGSVESLGPKG